jgi:two-component system sensor histidine kinase KdpD
MSVSRALVTPPSAGLIGRAINEPMGIVWGALTNVVTTTVAFWAAPHAQLGHLMIIHLLGAVLISTRFGMVVSTLTAITGALAFDYFCIPPVFAFALPDPHSVLTFAGILLVALFVCWLNQGVREQRAAARASEARTQALCELSLDLSQVAGAPELSARANVHLARLFGAGARFVLGGDVEAVPGFESRCVGEAEVLGHVLVPRGSARGRSADERRLLLIACTDRVADALLRLSLGAAARRAKIAAELERNRSALLSSVSHDLKTPLASILVAGTTLLREEHGAVELELLETIIQQAERMNGMIVNLLSVTRLESGEVVLSREPEELDELIHAALSRLSGRLQGREVTVDIAEDLPMIPLDAVLMDQLLSNLLENVLRYTPSGSPIDVKVMLEAGGIAVEIADRGPGIAPRERERVFDKFYRGQAANKQDGGTGLGLTICRAVARAHDGDIAVLPRPGGGSVVRFTLPDTPLSRPSQPSLDRSVDA